MHNHSAPAASTLKLPFYRQLYFQVVLAIVLGVLLGHFEPSYGEALKPLGDAFIKLVKMIIAPVIFLTIVTGIAGMSQLSTVGRVFGKAMAYFLFFSTLALVVGLVVANVVQPGAGMNINVADLDQTAVKGYVAKSHEMTLTGFALDIIPKTLVSPFVGDNILQVLLVAVLFGVGLAMVGEPGRPVLNFLEALTTPVFKVVGIVMKAAPLGAFGAMAFTIGKFGLGSLVNLAWLVGSFYITSLLFVLVILGFVCRLCGFSVLKLCRYLKAELMLVLGTSSSESALPSLMEKMEKAGCSKSVVGLVVPTGYSFNLDGTNIYMTLATAAQVQVAYRFGVRRVLLANQLVAPADIRAMLALMKDDPGFQFYALVDSGEGVQRLSRAAAEANLGRPLPLLVELGLAGKRAGCRTPAEAMAVAQTVARAPGLQLAGIEGYEGLLQGHDRAASVEAVRAFVAQLAALVREADHQKLFGGEQILLSAGGSAYFDLVAHGFAGLVGLSRPVLPVLRSGCYLTNDHGSYQDLTHDIAVREHAADGLRPALEVWSMVTSRPETTLAILSMGRRDASYDQELPIPLYTHRPDPGLAVEPTDLPPGCRIEKMNDQHAYLRLPEGDLLLRHFASLHHLRQMAAAAGGRRCLYCALRR
eukprot:gene25739-32228_t